MKGRTLLTLISSALLLSACGTVEKPSSSNSFESSESSTTINTSSQNTSSDMSDESTSDSSDSSVQNKTSSEIGSSVSSDTSTSESIVQSSSSENTSSESANSSQNTSSSEESSDDTSEEEEVVITATVSEACAAIDLLGDNKRSETKYSVTGYVTDVIEEYIPYRFYLTVAIADTLDGTTKLIAQNMFAETSYIAQEYVRGAKITITGFLEKRVSEETTTKRMVSIEDTILNESVLVNPTSLNIGENISLSVGQKQKLEAIWQPQNARKEDITWSSSNDEIVVVNESGLVEAKGVGIAKITANSTNFTKEIEVSVSEATAESMKITFGKYQATDSIPTSSIPTDSIIDTLIDSGNDYIASCDDSKYVLRADKCMKLNPNGFVTFTLKNQIKLKTVVIEAMKYQTNVANIIFMTPNFTGELTLQAPSSVSEFEDISYDIGCDVQTFTIKSSAKCFVRSITFILD